MMMMFYYEIAMNIWIWVIFYLICLIFMCKEDMRWSFLFFFWLKNYYYLIKLKDRTNPEFKALMHLGELELSTFSMKEYEIWDDLMDHQNTKNKANPFLLVEFPGMGSFLELNFIDMWWKKNWILLDEVGLLHCSNPCVMGTTQSSALSHLFQEIMKIG